MKREKKNNKICKQSQELQQRINRQQEILKEASETIMENVGQNLYLAQISLQTTGIEEPPAAKEKINNSSAIVNKAIKDLRQLGNHITEVMNEDPLVHKKNYETGAGSSDCHKSS